MSKQMSVYLKRLNKRVAYMTESVDMTTRGDHDDAKYFLLFQNTNTLIKSFRSQTEFIEWAREIEEEYGGLYKGYQLFLETLIKSHRLSAGLTQHQFADMFGISIDTVKAWDCGRRKPDKLKEKLIIEKLEQIKNNTI